jgi:hypothetical protein
MLSEDVFVDNKRFFLEFLILKTKMKIKLLYCAGYQIALMSTQQMQCCSSRFSAFPKAVISIGDS